MSYRLSNEDIAKACGEIKSFLEDRNLDSKEQLRIVMGAEEVLLNYRNAFGEDAVFMLDKGLSLGRKKIRLTVPGGKTDPFPDNEYDPDEDAVMKNALIRMGRLPRWRYRRGANEVVFTPAKKKIPEGLRLVIAIAAAVALGIIVNISPEPVGILLHDGVIGPLINTFLGFLNAVAGPMVFLSVVWGINSLGDASTFSEVGRTLSLRYGAFLCLMTIAGAVVSIPLFGLKFGSTQGGSDFSALYQMVLDIIPSNLFTPFSQGNTLQILFVAVIVGIAMLLVGKDTQSVADLTEQLGFIVDGIMSVISKLVPAFVFGSLFNIIVSSEFGTLAVGGKFFGATALGCAVLFILHTLAACIRLKMAPHELWKKTASTFAIAITTASSSAAFSDNVNTCINKLGVSRKIANFGVPFGQILYKPAVSILFLCAALSAAEDGLPEVSVTWMVTALLMSIVLSAAAPPVPGGMSASFAILFAQLGLGPATLAVILSLTSILDFPVTAANIFSSQCVLAITAKELRS